MSILWYSVFFSCMSILWYSGFFSCMSILWYSGCFSVRFFVLPIYDDHANWKLILIKKKITLNSR
jgi:hypothetical protein